MDGKRATSWTRPDGLRRGTEGKRRAPQDGPDPAAFPCFRYLVRYGFGHGHDHLDGYLPLQLKLRLLALALQVAVGKVICRSFLLHRIAGTFATSGRALSTPDLVWSGSAV